MTAAASLYAAIVRVRARQARARARRMLAVLDSIRSGSAHAAAADLARGGFFGFGKTKAGRKVKGKAKKLLDLPKNMRIKGGFYYVEGGSLYVKKR